MSLFHSLRKLAQSGTCVWWWILSVAWTEAMPLSLSALKKLHSRLSSWWVFCRHNLKKRCFDSVVSLELSGWEKNKSNTKHPLLTWCIFLLQCNNSEIRPGKHIGVCISVANNRLFVGSIPKSKTKDQIVEEFAKVTGRFASFIFLSNNFT